MPVCRPTTDKKPRTGRIFSQALLYLSRQTCPSALSDSLDHPMHVVRNGVRRNAMPKIEDVRSTL